MEKIFQSRGIIPILEGPKIQKKKKKLVFNFYLKLFIRYGNKKDLKNFENFENMTSHLMSPREIDDVKKKIAEICGNLLRMGWTTYLRSFKF